MEQKDNLTKQHEDLGWAAFHLGKIRALLAEAAKEQNEFLKHLMAAESSEGLELVADGLSGAMLSVCADANRAEKRLAREIAQTVRKRLPISQLAAVVDAVLDAMEVPSNPYYVDKLTIRKKTPAPLDTVMANIGYSRISNSYGRTDAYENDVDLLPSSPTSGWGYDRQGLSKRPNNLAEQLSPVSDVFKSSFTRPPDLTLLNILPYYFDAAAIELIKHMSASPYWFALIVRQALGRESAWGQQNDPTGLIGIDSVKSALSDLARRHIGEAFTVAEDAWTEEIRVALLLSGGYLVVGSRKELPLQMELNPILRWALDDEATRKKSQAEEEGRD